MENRTNLAEIVRNNRRAAIALRLVGENVNIYKVSFTDKIGIQLQGYYSSRTVEFLRSKKFKVTLNEDSNYITAKRGNIEITLT